MRSILMNENYSQNMFSSYSENFLPYRTQKYIEKRRKFTFSNLFSLENELVSSLNVIKSTVIIQDYHRD